MTETQLAKTDIELVREALRSWFRYLRDVDESLAEESQYALAALDRLSTELERLREREYVGDLSGEAIMLMRDHLKGVGIEATFADDVAALAAAEITHLRAIESAARDDGLSRATAIFAKRAAAWLQAPTVIPNWDEMMAALGSYKAFERALLSPEGEPS